MIYFFNFIKQKFIILSLINIRSGLECLLNKLINIIYLLFISDYLVTTTL